MAKLVKGQEDKVVLDRSIEAFSHADFTTSRYLSHSEDIPMWWKVTETPSLTYSEYKKNKKRKERLTVQLERYLDTVQEERRRYKDRLNREEARYEEELKVKDEAYKARAKQHELRLMIEAEEREKKLLEELEIARAKAREEALIREVERTRRLDEERQFKADQRKKSLEEKARLEKERLLAEAEAERIKAEVEAERERKKQERRQESARIKEMKLEAERREAEQLNAERLKKAQEEADRERALQAKLDEELRIEAERVEAEIAERERVKKEHELERARTQKEAERIEALKSETERKTVAQLKKAHKIRDVQFVYPPITRSDFSDKYTVVAKNLALVDRTGERLSNLFNFSAVKGLNVYGGKRSSDIYDINLLFARTFDTGLMSGGVKVEGIYSHELKRADYVEALESATYVMPYAVEDFPIGSIQKHVEKVVGVEGVDKVKRALGVLGENAGEILRSNFSKLGVSTKAKVMLACALNTNRQVVVLFEPKRTLDMPSRNAFDMLLDEWKKSDKEVSLLIFTGEKAGAK